VAGTWGKVSVLVRPGLMAITPSGSDYRAMGAAEGGKPSTERDLHAEIYRLRPEVTAVVHTHSMSASTVAAARREVPPILDDLAQIVGPSLDEALVCARVLE
jgi:L-fuculose-phosphate aldolase